MSASYDDLRQARELHALDRPRQVQALDALKAQEPARAERIIALLAELGADTAMNAAAPDAAAVHVDDSREPDRIGPFRILTRIGEGGMGAVYLAEQTTPARRVAIKIMRADWQSPEAHARFDREADVLARLEHPNIARIFESGMAERDGALTPYLAMEYVEGLPLSVYARQHQLSPRALVSLLATIADAVQHAHLRGVVHRDLKPGNILVDAQGQPHILDFGIAHLTEVDGMPAHHLTQTGQMIGTVQYMSPEQFHGDPRRIDGRTDVYALGVMAFELLTGEFPHRLKEASLLDAARIVTRQAPRTMSSLRRELRGDLELIVAKALAQDVSQRYPSAADFAADLRRFERHEPVQARAPSLIYRAQRFARRHWLPLAASALVLLSLAAGLVVSLQAAAREAQARALAERRADEAQAVTAFLKQMLNAASPDEAQGKELSVRAVVDKAVSDDSLRPENPIVRAKVDRLLGSLLIELGDPQGALALLDAATAVQEKDAYDPIERIQAHSDRAIALGLLGRPDESIRDARIALAQAEQMLPRNQELMDDVAYVLSLAQYNQNDLSGAEQTIVERLRPIAADAGKEAQGQIDLRNTLGRVYNASGRYQESVDLRREIMDWFLRVHGPRTSKSLSVQSNYAVALSQLDRDDEAAELLARTLPLRRELLGPDHVDVGVHEVNLATSLRLLGRYQESRPYFEDGYRIFLEKFGPEHPRTLLTAGYAADILTRTGQVDAGLTRLQQVLERYRAAKLDDSRWALLARNDYALALMRAGRLDAAEAELDIIKAARSAFASHLSLQAELDHAIGQYWLLRGDAAQAMPLLESALSGFLSSRAPGPIARRIAADLWQAANQLGLQARADALAQQYGLDASGSPTGL